MAAAPAPHGWILGAELPRRRVEEDLRLLAWHGWGLQGRVLLLSVGMWPPLQHSWLSAGPARMQ